MYVNGFLMKASTKTLSHYSEKLKLIQKHFSTLLTVRLKKRELKVGAKGICYLYSYLLNIRMMILNAAKRYYEYFGITAAQQQQSSSTAPGFFHY
jgi:hypothetical protein